MADAKTSDDDVVFPTNGLLFEGPPHGPHIAELQGRLHRNREFAHVPVAEEHADQTREAHDDVEHAQNWYLLCSVGDDELKDGDQRECRRHEEQDPGGEGSRMRDFGSSVSRSARPYGTSISGRQGAARQRV